MDVKWPAVAFQSIFLVANIAFLLDGKTNKFIIASVSVLMFLFAIQTISENPRFMYLFPVDTQTGASIPGLDTWILKGLIILSILFFFIGATNSYILPCVILSIGVGFPIIWKKCTG